MSQSAKASGSARSMCSPKNFSCPSRCRFSSSSRKRRRKNRESTRTEEEPRLARHPPVGIEGEAAAGYDAVNVRMMSQRRAPGMQHEGRADPGAQMRRIGGDRAQGLGGEVEQQCIENLLVGIGDGA